MTAELSSKGKKALLILLALLLFLNFAPSQGPAETGSFFNDILSDIGVSKTLSMATTIALFAIIGLVVIFYVYKQPKKQS